MAASEPPVTLQFGAEFGETSCRAMAYTVVDARHSSTIFRTAIAPTVFT